MTSETEELIRICESLPESKRTELTDFARFLESRQEDEKWEKMISDPRRRPKLEAFMRESASEQASPMDFDRL